MRFEYYVLNYNTNKKCVELFNIFDNAQIQTNVEKAVKQYLKDPEGYSYQSSFGNEKLLHGFSALVKEVDSVIAWQERGRRQYEISVGDAFETDCSKLQKFDCYIQAHANIDMIVRDLLRQYEMQKGKRRGNR